MRKRRHTRARTYIWQMAEKTGKAEDRARVKKQERKWRPWSEGSKGSKGSRCKASKCHDIKLSKVRGKQKAERRKK